MNKMFDIMNRKQSRIARINLIKNIIHQSKLVREDMSKYYLRTFQNDGFKRVVFVANIGCCDLCKQIEDNNRNKVFIIEDLLKLDNPLFRTTHPNCLCKFDPAEDRDRGIENRYY